MDNSTTRWFGFNFTIGGLTAAGLVFLVSMAVSSMLTPRDATDAPTGARSGVKLITDHGTGIQYLVTAQGGITPRLK